MSSSAPPTHISSGQPPSSNNLPACSFKDDYIPPPAPPGPFETSTGILVYRLLQRENAKPQPQYLMLQSARNSINWAPPKGHVEEGESDWVAALREVKEETCMTESQLELVTDWRHDLYYQVNNPRKASVTTKHVRYWLARLRTEVLGPENSDPVRISHEHLAYRWLPIEQAIELPSTAGFKDTVVMLQHAHSSVFKRHSLEA